MAEVTENTIVTPTADRVKRRIVAGTVVGTTSNAELVAAQARIAELEAALAKRAGSGKVTCAFRSPAKTYEVKDASGKVTGKADGKGNFLVYGIQRMPYSFYASGLVRFIEALPDIYATVCDNVDDASVKDSMTHDELAKRLEAVGPAIDLLAKLS